MSVCSPTLCQWMDFLSVWAFVDCCNLFFSTHLFNDCVACNCGACIAPLRVSSLCVRAYVCVWVWRRCNVGYFFHSTGLWGSLASGLATADACVSVCECFNNATSCKTSQDYPSLGGLPECVSHTHAHTDVPEVKAVPKKEIQKHEDIDKSYCVFSHKRIPQSLRTEAFKVEDACFSSVCVLFHDWLHTGIVSISSYRSFLNKKNIIYKIIYTKI